jgi:hypothetical protein
MKCFVHQNTDAIGVCSTCGRGLCTACVVKIGGKFYCKDDADRVFGRKLTTRVVAGEKERGAALMVGSILAYLVGGVAVVLSCFVLFAGILAGDLGGNDVFSNLFTPYFAFLGPVLNYSQSALIFIGLGVMVFGAIGIAAGFYLWRPAIHGALFAIVFGIMGLILAFVLIPIYANVVFTDGLFAVNILIIALALIGLRQMMLDPTRVR